MDDVKNLLNSVAQQIQVIETARKQYASRLSPSFSCFNYILPDEMKLSAIIADLLDPDGTHAQNDTFLRSFLKQLKLDQWLSLTKNVKVRTEGKIDSNRRVDIEVKFENKILIIENKPWAGDQENQVQDYLNYIKKNDERNFHLVYLSGSGQPPSNYSIAETVLHEQIKKGNITVADYSNFLVEWVQVCKSICQSERVRWFLCELELYILAEFKGEHDMQETHAVKKKILDSVESIKAAFEITVALSDAKKELFALFVKQLQNEAEKLEMSVACEGEHGTRFASIYFRSKQIKSEQQYVVAFEFEKTSLNGLIFGVAKVNENVPNKKEITDIMIKVDLNLGTGKTSAWWPWYASVKEEYRNWEKQSAPWEKIYDGSLAFEFANMAKKVYGFFEVEGKMDLLIDT